MSAQTSVEREPVHVKKPPWTREKKTRPVKTTPARTHRRYVFVGPDVQYGSWRTHWPAQGLMAAGEDVAVIGVGSSTTDVNIGKNDVFVIYVSNASQRSIDPQTGTIYGVEYLVRYIQAAGARVVLQLDDDYTAHSDIQEVDPGWHIPFMTDLIAGLRQANLVILATPPLVDIYGKWCRRTAVVRNYPIAQLWQTPVPLSRDRDVAWMGFIGTQEVPLPHRRDLGPVLPYLVDYSFHAVGDVKNVRKLLRSSPDPSRYHLTGTGPLSQVMPWGKPSPLYEQMGRAKAGICPLAEHGFNRSKSWIKALEFAIVGTIPVVPSWHPAYQELSELVPLYRYDDPADIRRVLDEILGAPEDHRLMLSLQISEGARELSMEATGAKEWQRALEQID